MIRGLIIGPLWIYLRNPIQVWWNDTRLLSLPFGWPNG